MPKAKILFTSFDEVPSFKGATTHILSTFRTLKERFDVTLVSLGDSPLPESVGIRHVVIPIREPNFLRRVEKFRAVLADFVAIHRFDAYHFRSPWEGEVLSGLGPSVFEVNGLPSVELLETHPGLDDALITKIRNQEDRCLARATRIVCPSERTRTFLCGRSAVDPSRIEVVPNGFDRGTGAANSHEARPGTQDTLRLVYVGTLHPWQGLLWSLKALRDLPIELDIFANENRNWTPLLRKRIKKYGLGDRVRMREPLAHVLLLREIAAYHAGFSPLLKVARNSEQGCFPIKNLDYLAAGIPVVASRIFVNQQLLSEKTNAVFFEPNRTQALHACMAALAREPGVLLGLREGALSSLDRHPTWSQYSDRIASIYDSILAGAREAIRARANTHDVRA